MVGRGLPPGSFAFRDALLDALAAAYPAWLNLQQIWHLVRPGTGRPLAAVQERVHACWTRGFLDRIGTSGARSTVRRRVAKNRSALIAGQGYRYRIRVEARVLL